MDGTAVPHPSHRRCLCFPPIVLPRNARGRWCSVRAPEVFTSDRLIAFLQLLDESGGPVGDPVPLRSSGRRGASAVLFAGAAAKAVGLLIVGRPRPRTPGTGRIVLRRVRPATAMLLLIWRNPGAWIRLLVASLDGNRRPFRTRMRLVQTELISPAPASVSYTQWLRLFESWSAEDVRDQSRDLLIVAMVFHRAAGDALAATLASLRDQYIGAVPFRTIGPGEDPAHAFTAIASGRPDDYVAILQAGEVLPPYAIAIAGRHLRLTGRPPFAITDQDQVSADGRRTDPQFRPVPGRPLMLSGTLSRGLWLIRRDVLARAFKMSDLADVDGWAEAFRLAVWLEAWRTDRQGGIRIAHVLCSRRPDTDIAPPALLAQAAARHLERCDLPFRATPTFPIRLAARRMQKATSVTAIVPSTLTAPHAERCLRALLTNTAHAGFSMIVAVSTPTISPSARAVAERLEAEHANVRVTFLPTPHFNFSWTVNQAAARATGTELLLLNDDVWPTEPDWLDRMVGWLADPGVGAVGARLLYPDGTIQHAGVVIGLAGLCEHAHRHRPGDDPGPEHRAQLPQSLLAVTGACMLIPAVLWRELGGLDESYPSAFNDVDLCLRIGEHGREVVLSDATLWHEESTTYGSHWADAPVGREAAEIERMRRRWANAIADDPYYNPNLDLRHDHAWETACPPRRSGPKTCGQSTVKPRPWLRSADRLRDVAWPSSDIGTTVAPRRRERS